MRAFGRLVVLTASALVLLPGAGWADPSAPAQATGSASPLVVAAGGRVDFTLDCGRPVDSASLTGTGFGLGDHLSMRRDGPGVFDRTLTVPLNAPPGHYHIDMQCSDGDSTIATVDVIPPVARPTASAAVSPSVGYRGQPVNFGLACAHRSAVARLRGHSLGLRHDVTMSPGGALLFGATVKLPKHLGRGHYQVHFKCGDGSSAGVDLLVR